MPTSDDTRQTGPETGEPELTSEEQRNAERHDTMFDALYAYLSRSPLASVIPLSSPYRSIPRSGLDLSPNQALPPFERVLQASLLKIIVEFGGIARDLDRVGSNDNGDFLVRFSPMWSDAISEAFKQAIEAAPGRWT